MQLISKAIQLEPELEAEYQLFIQEEKLRTASASTLAGASFYFIFGLIDKWLITNPIISVFGVRLAMVFLCLSLFAHINLYKSFFFKHYKVYILSIFLIMGLGADLMIYLVKPIDMAWHLVYGGLLLVITGIFLGTYLNTRYELAINLVLILIFLYIKLGVQHVHQTADWPILISNLIFIFCFCSIGVLLQNVRNYYSRLSFINHRKLLKDKETIARISAELEARKSDLEKSEQRFKHLALYDPLTFLANRRLLIQEIQATQASSANSKLNSALLFIDLDKFKQVNDRYGHIVGDELLRELAGRFYQCVRRSDCLARLGGDEFVVLLRDLHMDQHQAAEIAQSVAEKILNASNQTIMILGQPCQCSVSIGIQVFQGDTLTPEILLAQSDQAMYEAKKLGRNNFQCYHFK